MVIDAANGVEPQTRRAAAGLPRAQHAHPHLRQQDGPRGAGAALADGRDRARAGHVSGALHLAGGHGQSSSAACWICTQDQMRVFLARRRPRARARRDHRRPRQPGAGRALRRAAYEQAPARSSWCAKAAPAFDEQQFLAGRQTPMFFGSAINNFGVRRCWTRWSTWRRRPARAGHPARGAARRDEVQRRGVQDPGQHGPGAPRPHRLRARGLGRFERGMNLKVVRSGKELRPNTVVTFMSQRRELLDEAFAGDIIGIPNHGVLQLGRHADRGARRCSSPACPSSRRRCSAPVEVADPLRTKAAARRPARSSARKARSRSSARWAARCCCSARSASCSSSGGAPARARIRLQGAHPAGALQRGALGDLRARGRRCRQRTRACKRFIDGNAHRVAYDAVDAPPERASGFDGDREPVLRRAASAPGAR